MPLYEFCCAHCGCMIEVFVVSHKKREKSIKCEICKNDAFPVLSAFNTSPSIFVPLSGVDDTDDLTLGKLVANRGLPAEFKRKIKGRIDKYNEGKKAYNKRQLKHNFGENATTN